MAKQGHTDTDMGLADIFKEIEGLKSMCVKVGVTEDVGSQTSESGATLAQIATWNELGVLCTPKTMKKKGKWFIPPRPFVRGFADGKRELIAKTIEKLHRRVISGKLTAIAAIGELGYIGEKGIENYISRGTFAPNSPLTISGTKPNKKGEKFIKGKKSTRPLIDTGALRNSIRYQVIKKPVGKVSK